MLALTFTACGSSTGGSSPGGPGASGGSGTMGSAGNASGGTTGTTSGGAAGTSGAAGTAGSDGIAGTTGSAGQGGVGSAASACSVLNPDQILAAQGLQEPDWYKANIPFVDTPDANINGVYYYRWSTHKRALRYTTAGSGYIATEYDNPV